MSRLLSSDSGFLTILKRFMTGFTDASGGPEWDVSRGGPRAKNEQWIGSMGKMYTRCKNGYWIIRINCELKSEDGNVNEAEKEIEFWEMY